MLLVGIGMIGNNHVRRAHNQAFDRTANGVGHDRRGVRAAGQLSRFEPAPMHIDAHRDPSGHWSAHAETGFGGVW